MAAIHNRNTKPELIIRRGLHARGLRYRLCQKALPGKPDLVFPKYHAVIFVHGCFWHGHNCKYFKMPSSNNEFWRKKITENKERDNKVLQNLRECGWRTLIVWECATRKCNDTVKICDKWIKSDNKNAQIDCSGINYT